MGIDNRLDLLKKVQKSKENTKAYERLSLLFDNENFLDIDSLTRSKNDYAEVAIGFGTIGGFPAYAFAQNSDIKGGAMSRAQAAKICKVFELAQMTGVPIVGIYDSVGGYLTDGEESLAAYGDILLKSNNISGVVPQISVILGPCLGSSALVAASSDIIIASENVDFSLETNGENKLTANSDIVHIIAKNDIDALNMVKKVVVSLPSNNLMAAALSEYANGKNFNKEMMSIAYDIDSGKLDGSARKIINCLVDVDSFIELQKDFGKAFVLGIAKLTGVTIGVIASEGMKIDSDSCSKAARFIRFCDAFSIPVISFVNSTGFTSLREASKLSNAYSEATTAKITVIVGDAYGPLYIATAGNGANADLTLAWPTASVCALSPETAAIFLYGEELSKSKNPIEDRKRLINAYKDRETSPFKAAANGFIQDIIDPADTRFKVICALDMLSSKRVSRLPKKHSNIQV